jgi:hypothetical protein
MWAIESLLEPAHNLTESHLHQLPAIYIAVYMQVSSFHSVAWDLPNYGDGYRLLHLANNAATLQNSARAGLRRMRIRIGIISVFLLAAMAAETAAFAQQRPDREIAEADVREAVVRYQIKTWYLAVDSYCISVNRRNARKDFLERFASLPVKEKSACIEPRRGVGRMRTPTWVSDKRTGQPAVMFDVGSIRWLSEDEAEVRGGYYCAMRCWANGTYQVVRNEGRWTVKDFDIKAISSQGGE